MLRCLLTVALSCAVVCGCGGAEPPDRPGAPRAGIRRVVLVTCDTLRADRLGMYGYDRDVSPRLDELARDAVVFDEAYSAAPVTGPSLSSLFTGLMPDEIGVSGGNRQLLPPSVTTLAEVLRDAGIPTAAVVSNWALRRRESHGDAGLPQGFAYYDDDMTAQVLNRGLYERAAPETTDAAIAWLERQTAAGIDSFFLWVHYQDPHGPYTPPPEVAAALPRRPPSGEAPLEIREDNRGHGGLPAYQVIGGERQPDTYRDLYDAEIRYFDRELGRLLDWLRDAGLYSDSLIVFTADHGESLGEHDYWFCHGENVYREVVRVPFLVRYPPGAARPRTEQVGAVRRVANPVGHLDLWTTVLEAFDVAAEPRRGVSLFHAELPPSRTIPQSLHREGSAERWLGVSDGRSRLIARAGEAPRLYDIRADPGEQTDLAPSRPEQVARMLEDYERFLASLSELPRTEGPELALDEETRRGLEALGYLGTATESPTPDAPRQDP